MADDPHAPDHPGPWVVAIVMANRHYGGPEEGGWWYNTWDPADEIAQELARETRIGGVFWTLADAKAYAEQNENIVDSRNTEEGRPSKGSIACRGVYELTIFEGWPQSLTDRPDGGWS